MKPWNRQLSERDLKLALGIFFLGLSGSLLLPWLWAALTALLVSIVVIVLIYRQWPDPRRAQLVKLLMGCVGLALILNIWPTL